MKLARIDTFAVRVPRDTTTGRGGAGSPAVLQANLGRYALAETYGTVYARDLETLLVKITTADGMVGWGEAQAPIAPEVAQEIIHVLAGPLALAYRDSSPGAVRAMLYDAMRVRGHSGGFYVDAISAIDIALWDLAGKAAGAPLHRLLGGSVKSVLPIYVSGLTGANLEEQLTSLDRHLQSGARALKIFMAQEPAECLALVKEIRRRSSIDLFVDALWRFDLEGALRFAQELAAYEVGWLEAPLPPEDVRGHGALAEASPIPIAIGESYRTRYEIGPFFEAGALKVLQTDIGRSGVSEGNYLAQWAGTLNITVAPHISIGLGPQIAAAIHCAATWNNLYYVECNPQVYAIAERFQTEKFAGSASELQVSESPGLGIEMQEHELARYSRVKSVCA
jgi:D-galactarolactone cycloisomerase